MKTESKQPLHLLIDGADKTGKSTVCQILSRKLDLPVIKMKGMPEFIEKGLTAEASKLFNLTLVDFAEYSFIMDRGFTSSIVFDAVFNRGEDLAYLASIENILKPRVFILGKSLRLDEFNDDVMTRQNCLDAQKEFMYLADKRGYEVIDTSDKSPLEIADLIISKL